MTDISKKTLEPVIKIYKSYLDSNFAKNIDSKVISSLSNMLALYYTDKRDTDHSNNSIMNSQRISNYLGSRVIASYDFGTVLALFSIAISETNNQKDNLQENIEIEKNQNFITDEIISGIEEFDQLSELKEVTDQLIKSDDFPQISDYIHKHKRKYKEIFEKVSIKNPNYSKIDKTNEIIRVLNEMNKQNISTQVTKNTVTMIGTIAAGAALAFTCTAMLGVFAPIAIIPATVLGSRVASIVTEKISTPIFDSSLALKTNSKLIDKIISNNNPSKANDQTIQNSHEISEDLKKQAEQITYGKIKPPRPVKKEHSEEIINAAEALKKKIQREI
jgi:hypothetical protein